MRWDRLYRLRWETCPGCVSSKTQSKVTNIFIQYYFILVFSLNFSRICCSCLQPALDAALEYKWKYLNRPLEISGVMAGLFLSRLTWITLICIRFVCAQIGRNVLEQASGLVSVWFGLLRLAFPKWLGHVWFALDQICLIWCSGWWSRVWTGVVCRCYAVQRSREESVQLCSCHCRWRKRQRQQRSTPVLLSLCQCLVFSLISCLRKTSVCVCACVCIRVHVRLLTVLWGFHFEQACCCCRCRSCVTIYVGTVHWHNAFPGPISENQVFTIK